MPAAAVIPAPIAYIKVVAVKKLVVEFLATTILASVSVECGHPSTNYIRTLLVGIRSRHFTLRKLECFRQAYAGIY